MHNKLIGPNQFRVYCSSKEDSGRASINREKGANSIDLAICIICPLDNALADDVASGKVKKEPVKSPTECPYHELSHKANILMIFKDAYRKCDVYIYARQYDDRHPELAGPWSEVMVVTVP